MDLLSVLSNYLVDASGRNIHPFGNGLIHGSFLVTKEDHPEFILQEMNTNVFKDPFLISRNLTLLSDHLKSKDSVPLFPMPLNTLSGKPYVMEGQKCFRLIPYVRGSHSINVCSTPEEAHEASFQFGKFTASFKELNASRLEEPIVQFHDLAFRWKQFLEALSLGNTERITFAKKEIAEIHDLYHIVEKFQIIRSGSSFLKRVTHHDTKISNVLFDSNAKGICVIDLDTVMSGYFISDLGDMFRTYLSPANEEEEDLQRVIVRKDFFSAIVEGYLANMRDQMSSEELDNIKYAGEFMIYMQALRFMTDFINNDIYYGISHELNNYYRAKNQLCLLGQFNSMHC